MDVAADILAEMALTSPKEPTCHFMRLPLELRKRIYALLLLPPPVTRVHCSINAHSKQCSPGGRFLASTCKPIATVTRTVDCGTCEWRGGDVHAAILSTNQEIYSEASDVLYENSQVLCFRGRALRTDWPSHARVKIRRFVFVLLVDCDKPFDPFLASNCLGTHSGAKVIELHFDVDLTKFPHHHIDAKHFWPITTIQGVEVVVDVHIICAWDETDGGGCSEPISRRGDVREARALALDEQAQQMRLTFIEDLGKIFVEHGKTLVIQDN